MNYKYESAIMLNENYLNETYKNLNKKNKDKINKLEKINKILSLNSMILMKKNNIDINKIKYNYFGKPYLKNIYFNISHSGHYTVITKSNTPIGIDIQKIKDISKTKAKQFCNKKELNYIFSEKGKETTRYFEIYTIKEALIKMLGINLNYLPNIEVKIINNKYFIHNKIDIKTTNKLNGYIISICKLKESNY